MNEVTRPKSLNEIVVETQKILDVIIQSQGEMTPEIEAIHNDLVSNLASKVDSCAYVEKKIQAEADFFKDQAEYYTKIARSLESAKTALRQRVKEAMMNLGYQEICGERSRFKLVPLAQKLVLEQGKLPNDYLSAITQIVPDKERIHFDLAHGIEIPGARLEDNFALKQFANKNSK
jgi:hypothetical protein